MSYTYIDDETHMEDQYFKYTMSLVGGKWKMHILFWLSIKDVMRYNELKRVLEKISHKMLSDQLKELEQSGLILRKEYLQIPPKVEYSLTEKGKSLMPVLHGFCKWGMDNIDNEKE